MKRTTLFGSVAAGLLAASAAAPAWAQATTYPEGTDCAAIGNSASRTECMNQMDESRQNPISGNQGNAVSPGGDTDVAPGSANNPAQSGAAPAAPAGAEPSSPAAPAGAPATGAPAGGGATTNP